MGAACCIPSRHPGSTLTSTSRGTSKGAPNGVQSKPQAGPGSAREHSTKPAAPGSSTSLPSALTNQPPWGLIAASESPSPRSSQDHGKGSLAGAMKSLGESDRSAAAPSNPSCGGVSSVPASPSWLSRTSKAAAASAGGTAPASSASSRASSVCCSELAGTSASHAQGLQEAPSPSQGAFGLSVYSPACSLGRSSSSRSSRRKSSKVSNDMGQPCSWDIASPLMPLQEHKAQKGTISRAASHKGKTPCTQGSPAKADAAWKNRRKLRLSGSREEARVSRSASSVACATRLSPQAEVSPDQCSRGPAGPKAKGLQASKSLALHRTGTDPGAGARLGGSARSQGGRVRGSKAGTAEGSRALGRFMWPLQKGGASSASTSSRPVPRKKRAGSKSGSLLSIDGRDGSLKLRKALSFGRVGERDSRGRSTVRSKKSSRGGKKRADKGRSGKGGSKKGYRALSKSLDISDFGHGLLEREHVQTLGACGLEAGADWDSEAETVLLLERSRAMMGAPEDGFSSSRGGMDAGATACAGCTLSMMGRGRWRGWANESSDGSSPDAVTVSSVLACGHVFHADCLDHLLNGAQFHDPPCPRCTARATRQPREDPLAV